MSSTFRQNTFSADRMSRMRASSSSKIRTATRLFQTAVIEREALDQILFRAAQWPTAGTACREAT